MKPLSFLCSVVSVWVVVSAKAWAAASPLTDAQQACLAKAHREDRHGWIHLQVAGAPSERGFQHGYLLAPRIAEEIRVRAALWKHETAMDWSWLVKRAASMFTPRVDPENLAEIDGIVEGMAAAGVTSSRDELVAYNGYFELDWYWWPKELKKRKEDATLPRKEACSSFIATGSMTRDGGIVLGHNTWFSFAMASANVILDLRPERGHRIKMQTYPGWIHSGTDFFLTDAGLVGSETTIGGLSGFDEGGVPEFVRFRRATQDANSIDEWCALMQAGNNGGYANAWLLGDIKTGEIARLELGLQQVALERTRNGFFVGSNIAEDLTILRLEADDDDRDIRSSSIARRVRWKELMHRNAGKIDLALGQRMLADHYDAWRRSTRPSSRTLCGHGDEESEPGPGDVPFSPGGCFDAKVVDTQLAKRFAIQARWGRACGTSFNAAQFLARNPQFDWMKGLLKDRPRQPWTEIADGK